MKIPKKFKLFNFDIKVKISNNLIRDTEQRGQSKYYWKEIEIDSSGLKELKEQTFLHELVHMILDHMQEFELSQSEKFVNTFSELLYQALETMEY